MPSLPGFGVKVTPKGRKVFIVLYRTGGAGSKLRKYTIGPYGRVTLHQARVAAQRVFAAKLEGRDPAADKREAKRRIVTDRVEELLKTYIVQRLAQNRSGGQTSRLLRREIGKPWAGKSIHEISKRDVVEVVTAVAQRGAPGAANKVLKFIKTFCAGVWAGPSLSKVLPKACRCQPRRSLATVSWPIRNSPGLFLPRARPAVHTVALWNS